ncbi:MAG: hypothetical protein U1F81_15615 [Verrucomicrobiaceae bacterium]
MRSTNILLDDNLVQDMTSTGIRLGNSMYAKVTNNTVSNADNGIAFSSFRISDAAAADRVIQETPSPRDSLQDLVQSLPRLALRLGEQYHHRRRGRHTGMALTPEPHSLVRYHLLHRLRSAKLHQPAQPPAGRYAPRTATGNVIDGAALESTSTGHGYWLFYVDNNRDSVGTDHFGQISGGSVSNASSASC